jgi:hypothetical protein
MSCMSLSLLGHCIAIQLYTDVNDFSSFVSRLLLFYPISAVLTLFCNILMNPLGPHVDFDYELLSRVPSLLRGTRSRQSGPTELMHVKVVDDFINELSRLAKCAISNFRQEQT